MPRSHKEGALSRWSRLKLESTGVATEPEESAEQTGVKQENVTGDTGEVDARRHGEQELIELPSIDELGPDSDFQGFMDPKIDDSLRRAALKKLFSDPHFNVTDGLDVYAEDYTKLESMTPAMVAGLKHAQRLLFGDAGDDTQTDTTRHEDTLEEPVADKAIQEATLSAYKKEDCEGENGKTGHGGASDTGQENCVEAIPLFDADKTRA